jgi:hypothetical protein
MLRPLIAKLAVLALSTGPAAAATAPQPIGEVSIVHESTAAIMGRSLALSLSGLPALEATHVATAWAVSSERVRRVAVAEALEWTFPLACDAVILDRLASDPDPRIRRACARSAWSRRMLGLLDRLTTDADPEVRAIAARGR